MGCLFVFVMNVCCMDKDGACLVITIDALYDLYGLCFLLKLEHNIYIY